MSTSEQEPSQKSVESPIIFEREYARTLRTRLWLITEAELGHMLDISNYTVQVWRTKGGGPRFCKLGRNIFYTIANLT